MNSVPPPRSWYVRYGKRLFDLMLAAGALVLLFPLLVAVCLAIRVVLGGPIIFRQTRTGLGARSFDVLKFRTMTDARDVLGRVLPDVDRVTSFGRLLRRTSLDELPQLINILRGEMSIIGPRPLLARYEPYFVNEERARFLVRPGITGKAQISGRNDLSWDNRIAADVEYVRTLSLQTDARILFTTFATVLDRRSSGADVELQMIPFDEERKQRCAQS